MYASIFQSTFRNTQIIYVPTLSIHFEHSSQPYVIILNAADCCMNALNNITVGFNAWYDQHAVPYVQRISDDFMYVNVLHQDACQRDLEELAKRIGGIRVSFHIEEVYVDISDSDLGDVSYADEERVAVKTPAIDFFVLQL